MARDLIQNLSITGPNSFDDMWLIICQYYDDPAASARSALKRLQSLGHVKAEDYRSLTEFISEVEGSYTQLTTIDQIGCLTMLHVDDLCALLPESVKFEWHRRYQQLQIVDQLHPFPHFMSFLQGERRAISRLLEQQVSVPNRKEVFTHNVNVMSVDNQEKYKCVVHKSVGGTKHTTENCKAFANLSRDEKLSALREVSACFLCFGDHPRRRCPSRKVCSICFKTGHHTLLCLEDTNIHDGTITTSPYVPTTSH